MDDAPLVLYCRGRIEPRDELAVGIVGSRRCTMYGRQQAEKLGRSLASWTGLTIGSCLGFGLARYLGHPFARRFADPDDIIRIQNVADRFGWMALLITRPLPILAEACVMLMGTTTLSWRQFLIPIVSGNLVLSFVYAACGAAIEDSSTLLVVAVASGTVPLMLALVIRHRLS